VTARALRKYFDISRPRIGVCGLNPHASDGGRFGTEETRIIAPAVTASRRARVSCTGPLAPDTAFVKAIDGAFDAVVAMYHDQGLIPLKCHAFGRAVNITLGLPIIRTSVDHGTAFDIVGKGIANPGGMITAIETALQMCGGAS
jgi:4-hydroxythreonine-4-phosphate dehydrogenase